MKRLYSIITALMLMAGVANADTYNVVCTSGAGQYVSSFNAYYVQLAASSVYQFNFLINLPAGQTDIVNGTTYTLNDMDEEYSFGLDYLLYEYAFYSSVSLTRNTAGDYTVTVVSEAGNTYNITYTAPLPVTVAVDSVSITMDHANNEVTDAIASAGILQLIGYDQNEDYEMYLAVNTSTWASSYTQSDLNMGFSSMGDNGGYSTITYLRTLTVSGTDSACTAYAEFITEDSILYKITYTYPGIVPPLVINDTVDITMDNDQVNEIDNWIDDYGYFTLVGADQTMTYGISIDIFADSVIAGTYTFANVDADYSTFYKGAEELEILDVRALTITGTDTACGAYIELVAGDSILYRINYSIGGMVPPEPTAVDNLINTNFTVCSLGHSIMVYGAEGQMVEVYDMAGRTVMTQRATTDILRLDIATPGIYVIRAGNTARKAVVR